MVDVKEGFELRPLISIKGLWISVTEVASVPEIDSSLKLA